jgi:hypothetical protein
VVSSDNGQPLRRATVRIAAPVLKGARSALTDIDGRYEFRDLPAGRYSINVSRPAFVNWAYGQTQPNSPGKPLVLADNQTADHVDVRLPRGSVITGRITDEFGEPVPNAFVTPMRSQYMQGQRRLQPVGGRASTNDIGEYRVFGLAPGQYYVSANLEAPIVAVPNANTADVSGESNGYAPTFFPSTSDTASAQKLVLGVAQTLSGIDIALRPTRLATISGVAIDGQGHPMTRGGISAVPVHGIAGLGARGGQLRPDGTFTVPNVAPGEYVLRANAPVAPPAPGTVFAGPPEFSVAVVIVNGSDVIGVQLAPVVPVTISGHVSFDDIGAAQSPAPSGIRVTAERLNQDDLATGIAGRVAGPPPTLQDDFTFQLKTAPGRIGLRAIIPPAPNSPNAWQLKSLRVNGLDVTDTGIAVSGQGVSGVEIEMTNRLPQLLGTVTDAKGDAVKDYAVALFAQDRARWLAPMNRYFAVGRPGDDGGFKVATLPPGEYYAIALERIDATDWQDPETLEQLSRLASTFVLTPGDTRTLDLRLMLP